MLFTCEWLRGTGCTAYVTIAKSTLLINFDVLLSQLENFTVCAHNMTLYSLLAESTLGCDVFADTLIIVDVNKYVTTVYGL